MPDIFYGVAALACPVGMGAMMWFMGKGMRGKAPEADPPPTSVDALREEHRRLGTQIERLESASRDNGRRPTQAHR